MLKLKADTGARTSGYFEPLDGGNPGIKVSPDIRPAKREAWIAVETWPRGGAEVWLEIQTEYGKEFRRTEIVNGHTYTNIIIKNVHFWDGPDDPYLYTITARLVKKSEVLDEISTRFACRRSAAF